MFKKTLAIILCLALLMLPCLAGAYVPLAIDGSAANINAENDALRVCWQDAEATVYLPVKRYQQTSGGWSEAQTYYPAVIRITYQYWTEKSAATDDTWAGAAWLDNGYPAYTLLLTPATQYLEPSVQNISNPSYNFNAQGDSYSLQIAGGVFRITYNGSLYYRMDGTLDHTERTTVRRTHNITITGP